MDHSDGRRPKAQEAFDDEAQAYGADIALVVYGATLSFTPDLDDWEHGPDIWPDEELASA